MEGNPLGAITDSGMAIYEVQSVVPAPLLVQTEPTLVVVQEPSEYMIHNAPCAEPMYEMVNYLSAVPSEYQQPVVQVAPTGEQMATFQTLDGQLVYMTYTIQPDPVAIAVPSAENSDPQRLSPSLNDGCAEGDGSIAAMTLETLAKDLLLPNEEGEEARTPTIVTKRKPLAPIIGAEVGIEEKLEVRDAMLGSLPGTEKAKRKIRQVEGRYDCDMCSASFKLALQLYGHLHTHTSERRFTCNLCPPDTAVFSQAAKLVQHERRFHTSVRQFECETCGNSFDRASQLQYHVRRIHLNEKPFCCEICSKGFFKQSDLKTHLNVHLGISTHTCPTCGKHFSHVSNLTRHVRTHTGVKPYVCSVCGRRFSQSSVMEMHKLSHEVSDRVTCAICPKHFKSVSLLRRHVRIAHPLVAHSDTDTQLELLQMKTGPQARRYYCNVCGEAFQFATSLHSHERTHKEQGINCSSCQTKFATLDELKKHSCREAKARVQEQVQKRVVERARKRARDRNAQAASEERAEGNEATGEMVIYVSQEGQGEPTQMIIKPVSSSIDKSLELLVEQVESNPDQESRTHDVQDMTNPSSSTADGTFDENVETDPSQETQAHDDQGMLDPLSSNIDESLELLNNEAEPDPRQESQAREEDQSPESREKPKKIVMKEVEREENNYDAEVPTVNQSYKSEDCEDFTLQDSEDMGDIGFSDGEDDSLEPYDLSKPDVLVKLESTGSPDRDAIVTEDHEWAPVQDESTVVTEEQKWVPVPDESTVVAEDHEWIPVQEHDTVVTEDQEWVPVQNQEILYARDQVIVCPHNQVIVCPPGHVVECAEYQLVYAQDPDIVCAQNEGVLCTQEQENMCMQDQETVCAQDQDNVCAEDQEGLCAEDVESLCKEDEENVCAEDEEKVCTQDQDGLCAQDRMSSQRPVESAESHLDDSFHLEIDQDPPKKTRKRKKRRPSTPMADRDQEIEWLPQDTLPGQPKEKTRKQKKSLPSTPPDRDQETVLPKDPPLGQPKRKRKRRERRPSTPMADRDREIEWLPMDMLSDKPKERLKRIYHCPDCGKQFNKNSNYKQHLGIHHTEQQKYVCLQCDRRFAWKSSLNKHLIQHNTDFLPYGCDQCERHFLNFSQLHEHVKRDHYNERSHICSVCDKAFYKRHDLKLHMRIHTNEKPYLCGSCGKCFAHPSHLIRHERVHSGLKPYVCECGSRFTQSNSLHAHRRSKHPNGVDADADEPQAVDETSVPPQPAGKKRKLKSPKAAVKINTIKSQADGDISVESQAVDDSSSAQQPAVKKRKRNPKAAVRKKPTKPQADNETSVQPKTDSDKQNFYLLYS